MSREDIKRLLIRKSFSFVIVEKKSLLSTKIHQMIFSTELEFKVPALPQVTTIVDRSLFRDIKGGHNSPKNNLRAKKFRIHAIILY